MRPGSCGWARSPAGSGASTRTSSLSTVRGGSPLSNQEKAASASRAWRSRGEVWIVVIASIASLVGDGPIGAAALRWVDDLGGHGGAIGRC